MKGDKELLKERQTREAIANIRWACSSVLSRITLESTLSATEYEMLQRELQRAAGDAGWLALQLRQAPREPQCRCRHAKSAHNSVNMFFPCAECGCTGFKEAGASS